jgi:hypothetical protein
MRGQPTSEAQLVDWYRKFLDWVLEYSSAKDRKRNTGDLHGQAPVLWCAAAFLRK